MQLCPQLLQKMKTTLIVFAVILGVAMSANLRETYNQRVTSVQKMERKMNWVPKWLAQHEGVV